MRTLAITGGLTTAAGRGPEARQRRQKLHESEDRFRSLFEDAPIAYHEIDSEGVIQRVNQTECRLLGYQAPELVGRHIWEFLA